MDKQISYHDLSASDFNLLIDRSKKVPVILVFAAEWLGSVHILESFLKDILVEYPAISVFQIDVDKNEDLAVGMNVSQLPTTFFFKNGEVVDHFLGVIPKKKIRQKLQTYSS